MNGAWAVVPVKCFGRGKSRLSEVLDAPAREELARSLCDHVLGVLGEVASRGLLDGVLVSTDCPDVEHFVQSRGARVIADAAVGSLASIVDGALGALSARGARAALILMSDLPLLAATEVEGLVRALDEAPLVLAPDRRGEGTNALGLAPPNRLATCFGTLGSFELHRDRAAREGLSALVFHSEGTACDLDSPDDLAFVRAYADCGARLSTNRNRPSRVRAA